MIHSHLEGMAQGMKLASTSHLPVVTIYLLTDLRNTEYSGIRRHVVGYFQMFVRTAVHHQPSKMNHLN